MEDEIKTLEFGSSAEQKEALRKELKDMDITYTQLQKELRANPNDERIINAMIEHYQTKVDVMNYILSQLKAVKNENNKNTENEDVSL
jgi:uncharacterized protein (DUF305 family)